ncbi:MAG TPA: hypothetical protein VGC16_07755 [Rhizomicrobium sp.]
MAGKEIIMSTNEIAFLALVICSLTLFAGTLGWASWLEARATKKRRE